VQQLQRPRGRNGGNGGNGGNSRSYGEAASQGAKGDTTSRAPGVR